MTERIYDHDSYCKTFTAKVVSCEKDGECYRIELDRTAFFPEGGGQAADEGTLNGITVLDVQREGETVIHTTAEPLEVGLEVEGELNWELRYSRMQSHTGEHILSGIIYRLYGYTNVGFHMAEAIMTVDTSGPLSQKEIDRIELESNRAIYGNSEITVSYPTEEELSSLNYRSKIEVQDDLRIVTIGDVDCCACCAPHLARAGEVGLIKVLNFYPNKQGTRIEMLAGINAFKDYCALNTVNKNLMKLLSAPRNGVEEAVKVQNAAIHTLRSEKSQISQRLALHEMTRTKIGDSLYAFGAGLTYDELRYCANTITEKECQICVLFSETEDGSYLYVAASKYSDVRRISKALNEGLSGKGGGKENYVQGKIAPPSKDNICEILNNLLL